MPAIPSRLLSLLLTTALLPALVADARAQQLVGIGWNGRLHAIDGATGAAEPIAQGPFGANDLTRDGQGQVWSTARLGSTFSFFLTRVDPVAGNVTFAWPSLDVRGLAPAGGSVLWALETLTHGAPARLHRIDVATGAHVLVGSLGQTAIQSLAVAQGTLYGWHWVHGLMVVDMQNGLASDPYPATAAGLVVQWLVPLPGGDLLGGTATSLYRIDPATGVATLQAALPPGLDLRGATLAPFAAPYGNGCDIGKGPLTLRAAGEASPGQVVTLQSTGHLPGTLRGIGLGFSRDVFQGRPLPLLLDPLLGTSGCHLYASLDLSEILLGASFPTGTMSIPLRIPPGLGTTDVYVQHFDFALPWNPPGASNGLHLHIRN